VVHKHNVAVQEGQVKKQAAEPHPVSAVDATPISITASDATPALTTTAATVKRSNSYDASRFNNVILASNKEVSSGSCGRDGWPVFHCIRCP